MHGTTTAMKVLVDRQRKIERMKSRTENVTGSYTKFYYKLASYHTRFDQHDNLIECHKKIALSMSDFIEKCKSDQCSYSDLGSALYAIGKYEQSSRSLELALILEDHDIMTKTVMLVKLHKSFIQ